MKKITIIALMLVAFLSCKKKEPIPEPEPTTTGSTSTDKKIYCIYYTKNGSNQKLQCGEMTTDEAIQVCKDYRDKGQDASAEVKSSCSACP